MLSYYHTFIHSFNIYLPNIDYVPGTILGAGNKTVKGADSSKVCFVHNSFFVSHGLLEDLPLPFLWLSTITLYNSPIKY